MQHTDCNFLGIQEIDCDKGDPFVLLLAFGYTSVCISFFATAAFSIERVIAIAKPFQTHAQEDKRSTVLMVILTISIISFCMYFPMAFEKIPMHVNMDIGTIAWDCPHSVWCMYISIAVANIIIVPSNIILLYKLHQQHRLKRFLMETRMDDDTEQVGCTPMLDLRMTFVLILISSAFVLLTIPRTIIAYRAYRDLPTDPTGIDGLVNSITYHIFHVNFSCNSIFYFFLASDCRKELKKSILKCWCKC